MTKTFCDLCGEVARPIHRLTIETPHITMCDYELCKDCAYKIRNLIDKMVRERESNDSD